MWKRNEHWTETEWYQLAMILSLRIESKLNLKLTMSSLIEKEGPDETVLAD